MHWRTLAAAAWLAWTGLAHALDREGFVDVPGGKVWYRIEGADKPGTPILLLHGGPGATSYGFAPFAALADERPVVFYDQLGCGRSERPDDPSLWTIPRFVAELAAVRAALGLDEVHLLGHSWGTILALEYLMTQPAGVRSVAFASPSFDIPAWLEDTARLRADLPADVQATLAAHEAAGTTAAPGYQDAVTAFYQRHLLRLDPWPEPMTQSFEQMGIAVYNHMWGPNEFTATGSLKDYDRTDALAHLDLPVLYTAGEFDEARPETVRRFQRATPNARMAVIAGAAHMTFLDAPDENVALVRAFLHDVERSAAVRGDVSADLATMVATLRQTYDLPGVTAALRLPDGAIVTATDGFADVERQVAMTPATRLQGGSTGKTFVAAIALQLVEEGVLDLDAPISRWLGDAPWFDRLPNGPSIRLRHLLSHSAGLVDHVDEPSFALRVAWRRWTDPARAFTPEELVDVVLDREPLFAPGDGYRYTDTGYILVGLVIEKATGRRYEDLLTERILVPLALGDVRIADTMRIEGLAPGYVDANMLTFLAGLAGKNMSDDGTLELNPGTEWTGGGLATTPSMLVSFYAALADGRVVAPETLQHMMADGPAIPDRPGARYGYGLYVDDGALGRAFGHGGWYPGYRTIVRHWLEPHVTLAVQTNADPEIDVQTAIAPLVDATLSRIADTQPLEERR